MPGRRRLPSGRVLAQSRTRVSFLDRHRDRGFGHEPGVLGGSAVDFRRLRINAPSPS